MRRLERRGSSVSTLLTMHVAQMRMPAPIHVVLVLLLVAGPVGLLASRGDGAPRPADTTLAGIATAAGCTLREFEDGAAIKTNPPVTGRFVEHVKARDGSYVGRRPPSRPAAIHALLHGRVLYQYRDSLPAGQLRALEGVAARDAEAVLLFENRTGMTAPVAATAYLSLMTCPRVDATTVKALDAFRARRRGFGQSF